MKRFVLLLALAAYCWAIPTEQGAVFPEEGAVFPEEGAVFPEEGAVLTDEGVLLTEEEEEPIGDEETVEEGAVQPWEQPYWYVEGCIYYCVYDDEPYCCDLDSSEVPFDHMAHAGECPPEEDQICKNSGIYLHSSTKLPWVKGYPKDQPMCASDGYCQPKEKCCPSPCVRRHLCMKRILTSPAEEEAQEILTSPAEEEAQEDGEPKERTIMDDEMEGGVVEEEDVEMVKTAKRIEE